MPDIGSGSPELHFIDLKSIPYWSSGSSSITFLYFSLCAFATSIKLLKLLSSVFFIFLSGSSSCLGSTSVLGFNVSLIGRSSSFLESISVLGVNVFLLYGGLIFFLLMSKSGLQAKNSKKNTFIITRYFINILLEYHSSFSIIKYLIFFNNYYLILLIK
ncbi:hypothetical protein BGAPBR_I0051 (plasmid) [Borreliella garinii PBr]|uniref:Uncharacterized protein n=1 Tax=Borreliella garinii PBr TaxID=498743 RepID=B8F129_BORGR|nr:hypothetical protein BGAPBR_I0051 [Borreliella garinii PBr]